MKNNVYNHFIKNKTQCKGYFTNHHQNDILILVTKFVVPDEKSLFFAVN